MNSEHDLILQSRPMKVSTLQQNGKYLELRIYKKYKKILTSTTVIMNS